MTLPIIPHESYTDAGAHVGHHPNHLKKPKSSSSAHHTDFSTTKSKFKHNSPTLQLAVSQTANLSHSSNHPLFISLYGAPNLPISSPHLYSGFSPGSHTRFLHDLTYLRKFEKSDNLCIQTCIWEAYCLSVSDGTSLGWIHTWICQLTEPRLDNVMPESIPFLV